MIIDTHCHLFNEYYDNIEEVIKKMGSNIMIVNGTNNDTNKEVIGLCKKYNNVYGTLGIHPSEVQTYNKESISFIEHNINNPKIVGVGEIGLDYYWTSENKEIQQEIFIEQIRLAKKHNKTIIIHSRDAINDTYNILEQEKILKNKVIMHCYGSSLEMAYKFTKLGVMLGIGGVITFKNANKLIEVVKNIDLKYLLLETDSPFLSPEPYRGHTNEPANVKLIAAKVAEIKNIKIEEVYEITTNNALRQFDLKLNLC